MSRSGSDTRTAVTFAGTQAGVDAMRLVLDVFRWRACGVAVSYEAGPVGWQLNRLLDKLGVARDVIARSLVPARAPVARYAEIPAGTVRAICRALGVPAPPNPR